MKTGRLWNVLSAIFAPISSAPPAGSTRGNQVVQRTVVRARYDAAQTNTDNTKHWSGSDGLSALAANAPEIRRILRNRSRYEVANNGYADGITQTLANDTIGRCPRLQLRSGSSEACTQLEDLWGEWSRAVDLEGKLWTMRVAKTEDGEAFGVFVNNPRLAVPVKLDLHLVEADQVSTPTFSVETPRAVDGIVFDSYNNPVEYHILKSHPGDPIQGGGLFDYDRINASNVVHYFRARRPGQKRGVPEITSSISLFASLRRYTNAVLAAAETAADFAMVLESNAPATDDEPVAVEAMDTIELTQRQATVLPSGWKLGQTRPEQPTTTYPDFKREILTEIARPLNMPYNIAAGNSSSYNYASGRLDHQTYFKSIEVERSLLVRTVLEPIFRAWLAEAMLIPGLVPAELLVEKALKPTWLWDGREHVDPAKEASAQETKLNNNMTTLAAEYGKQGLDWEVELTQIARERELKKKLGLLDEMKPSDTKAPPAKPQDPEDPQSNE